MPLLVTAQIVGIEAFLRRVRDRGAVMGAWRSTVTKATYAIHDEVFRRTPRVTGHLQRSLTTQVDPSPLPMWGRIGTNVSYAPDVHFGTRAHEIRPRRKRALSWRGARHPVRRVWHPGTRAQPFMTEGMRAALPLIVRLLRACGDDIAHWWSR